MLSREAMIALASSQPNIRAMPGGGTIDARHFERESAKLPRTLTVTRESRG